MASSKDRTNGAVYAKTGVKLKEDFAKSLDTWQVVEQCDRLIPEFKDVVDKCNKVIYARNADVHSSERPWANNNLWVDAYLVIDACLKILGESPEDFFGDHADAAKEVLDSYNERLNDVWVSLQGQAIGRLKKPSPEEIERRHQAFLSNAHPEGSELRPCPVCERQGVLMFRRRSLEPRFDAESGDVIQTGHKIPAYFSCSVCGLDVVGSRLLGEAKLGDPEYFEEPIPALDALTEKQAHEQINERFRWQDLADEEDLELYHDGLSARDYFDSMRYDDE